MAVSPGREEIRTLSISVSGGTGTGSVTRIWAIARWVRVIPVNESATYDVTFKDADGDMIVYRTSITGTFSEQLELSLGSVSSVVIANATADGTYKVKLDMN